MRKMRGITDTACINQKMEKQQAGNEEEKY
jgi:hypothetical protein